MPMQKDRTVSATDKLRHLLKKPEMIVMSACYDALSAKLIEAAGFPATFMSGFGVAATRLGLPDTGLISYGELLDQGRNICSAVSIPVLGDGDTGFGNAMNVKRTVRGYHQAGFACVMIEDQMMPKRCGHTAGKEVVDFDEALKRINAAIDARKEGADITFLEAPQSEEEMRSYCENVPGLKMANLIENGKTPLLPMGVLHEMGFKIAVYALTLLNASIGAMQQALTCLKQGMVVPDLMDFQKLQRIVGFDEYDAELGSYHSDTTGTGESRA